MTSTDLQVHEGGAVAPFFGEDQKALIKRVASADGLTDDEFQIYIHTAERLRLDPLARQIYGIKRGGKMTIQTGIDGYRAVADRTGLYAGNDDADFTGPDDNPTAATVTVWKIVGGVRCAFTATARWSEYCPEKSHMWKKMPHTMLAKCAEALALRKAFPAQLSGVYTTEEMAQAGPSDAEAVPHTPDGEVQDEMTRDSAITWGKKSGTAVKDLPTDYLNWSVAPGRKFGHNTEAWQALMLEELEARRQDAERADGDVDD